MAKKDSGGLLVIPPPVIRLPVYIEGETGHINVQLYGSDTKRWRRFHAALVAGARFADGRPVQSKKDVILWVIEQAEKSWSKQILVAKEANDEWPAASQDSHTGHTGHTKNPVA